MNTKNKMKRTIVFGASPNPSRYAYKAVQALNENDIEVFPLGIREGEILGIPIITDRPKIAKVETISIYISAEHQPDEYDYILGLNPKRIIFNPGAENQELAALAHEKKILTENACTLVLLRTGQF